MEPRPDKSGAANSTATRGGSVRTGSTRIPPTRPGPLGLGRRDVLTASILAGLAPWVAGHSAAAAADETTLRIDYPFELGVASGDPRPDGVVLWTRLAPDPLFLDGSGGMPPQKVAVRWQVAKDERFTRVLKRGSAYAVPELAHSVHVEVEGLRPNRTYYYRFAVGGHVSPVGRTRTAPDPGSHLSELRFGLASCQVWWGGFYTAYAHMASDDLDVVFHVGDYIYEGRIPQGGLSREVDLPAEVRTPAVELHHYRLRYALFHSDPDLQAAHAAHPFVITWDDHEVQDNWASDFPRNPDVPTAEFLARRSAGAQAFYENLPLRLSQRPEGPDIKLYRRFTYGDLATFHVLDGRLFRDDQACGDGAVDDCAERLDPARTMLGTRQERWLYGGLSRSRTTWNVLANQVVMTQVDLDVAEPKPLFMDAWDGYVAGRDRLFDVFANVDGLNPIVLSGDRHRHMAADLKADFDDPDSRSIGVEFVGTSISSGRDGEDMDAHNQNVMSGQNPHIKFMNSQRGYVRLTATHDLCRGEHLAMPYISTPGAPISTRASFVTLAGNPGLQTDT